LRSLSKEVQRMDLYSEPFGSAFDLRLEDSGKKPNHRYILRVAEVGKRSVAIGPPFVLRDTTAECK
jgi:hypothetical protein